MEGNIHRLEDERERHPQKAKPPLPEGHNAEILDMEKSRKLLREQPLPAQPENHMEEIKTQLAVDWRFYNLNKKKFEAGNQPRKQLREAVMKRKSMHDFKDDKYMQAVQAYEQMTLEEMVSTVVEDAKVAFDTSMPVEVYAALSDVLDKRESNIALTGPEDVGISTYPTPANLN